MLLVVAGVRLVEWIHTVMDQNTFNMTDELYYVAERANEKMRETLHQRAAEDGVDLCREDGTWAECGDREEGLLAGRESLEALLTSLVGEVHGQTPLTEQQLHLLKEKSMEQFDLMTARVWNGESVYEGETIRNPDPWDYEDNCEFLADVFMSVFRRCWEEKMTLETSEDGMMVWRERLSIERPLVRSSVSEPFCFGSLVCYCPCCCDARYCLFMLQPQRLFCPD